MSPAMAGRFLTTAPPGKSSDLFLFVLLVLMALIEPLVHVGIEAVKAGHYCVLDFKGMLLMVSQLV